MSVLHLNIRSIRYKLDFIKDNFLDFDVLCFTETHLTNDISNELLELDGFLPPFRKDRQHILAAYSFIFLTNLSLNVDQI